jgi:hypothetical protein
MSEQPAPNRTIAVVLGALAEASSWNGVIDRLQQQGYTVGAPANPLPGVVNDRAYPASVVNEIDGPVLPAGHSYGRALISNAATDAPNVVGLVVGRGPQTLGDKDACRRRHDPPVSGLFSGSGAHRAAQAPFVDGEPVGNLTRDNIVDNITLYWLTGTGASAARWY